MAASIIIIIIANLNVKSCDRCPLLCMMNHPSYLCCCCCCCGGGGGDDDSGGGW